ncbi:hypothetical protein [Actinophytocola sp. NPDC049390]|uniref:hypothetical protein n=1 Tax=Actinophytocola sp. NPDC049390 TaxID=3363894 RepID=UPI003788A73C
MRCVVRILERSAFRERGYLVGSITILNGTNVPINSAISAGVNYSWCNELFPKEYYVHNGAAGVYSLNTRFWLGEESEYSNNGTEIGLWVAGVVLGIVGIVAIPITGGATAPAVAFIGSALAGGAGLAVGGISIAAREFTNEPNVWTNIHAIHDRKFIAEGTVDLTRGQDGVITYNGQPKITLRQLSEEEFETYRKREKFVEHGTGEAISDHATVDDLKAVLDKPVRLFPALGGRACWEVENDQTAEHSVMQLWERDTADQTKWEISAKPRPTDAGTDCVDTFYLYNTALGMYASSNGERMVTTKNQDAAEFRIYKSAGTDGRFAFMPVAHPNYLVIPESGNLGNSTKLRLALKTSLRNPLWARWKLNPAG